MVGGPQLLIILALVLLLFGGSKLPGLARSLGAAQSEFKRGLEQGSEPDDEAEEKSA
jgi:sec-independent protein translocase protein TatA